MIVIDENSSTSYKFETYIALGSFDGLHIGHMSLINKTIALANKYDCKSMVYTFKNHPLSVINKDLSPKLLMDCNTKIDILEESGIDIVCLVEFNQEFMKMSPESFVLHIKTKYNMKGVVVGFNYRFGYKNEGDVNLLKILGEKYGFEVYVMDALKVDDDVVSSSKIRRLIQEGDISFANKLMMRPFALSGIVVSGKRLGRQLGFPTANVSVDDSYLYPKIGVYYTNVDLDGEIYKGITNIGFNPTVNGDSLSFETYILDFEGDIYGENITVYFIERMRNEEKFNSKKELVNQMELDKKYAADKKIELNIKK